MPARQRSHSPRLFAAALSAAAVLPLLVSTPPARAEVAPETVVGRLVQAFSDPVAAPDGGDQQGHDDEPGLLSWIRSDSGEAVRVPTEDVTAVEVGSTVEVTVGAAVVDEASERGLEPALEVLAAEVLAEPQEPTTASATAPVNHPVTVVMLQPAGVARDSTTLAQVVSAVNVPVADFWDQQSRGAVRFGVVSSVDWGAPATVGCDQPFQLWEQAAARAGWSWTDNAHLLVYLPANAPGCGAGLGTVGAALGDGGLSYVTLTRTSVVAHEFGHNLGLGHASGLQCDGTVDSGTCSTAEYRDLYDVMGLSWGQVGSLSTAHAAHLGLLPETEVGGLSSLDGATTFTLSPVAEAPAQGALRTVRLTSVDGTRYWLEFRQAGGQDAWLGDTRNVYGLQQGVVLRRSADGRDTSLLYDGSPSRQADWGGDLSVALPVGVPRPFANGEFTVTVQGTSTTAATVLVTPETPISQAYRAAGGETGVLGAPTATETCDPPGPGRTCSRLYEHGAIYWSTATGARPVQGAFYAPWVASGGIARWGLPTDGTTCGLTGGGCRQSFTSAGLVYWSPGTGMFATSGAIRSFYLRNGGPAGLLGYPVADLTCGATSCEQAFQAGTTVWSPSRGTIVVQGPIRDAWTAGGGAGGALGLPTTVLGCGMVRNGCGQQFENGSLYWSPETGAHAVTGPIWNLWIANGWERGPLGYASGGMECGLAGGGCRQAFQGGTVTWSASTGAQFTNGAIGAAWVASGREAGALGYPSLPMGCGLPGDGCGQQFQGGSVYWTAATGAHAVTGPIWGLWTRLGWERGPLRYATGALTCGLADGGCRQAFQGGIATWSSTTGGQFTNGAIGAAWTATGAEAGALGYPSLPMGCGLVNDGCGQQFVNGSVYWTPVTGAHAVTGPIWSYWITAGWERGPLGYARATLDCTLTGGGCRQDFTGGSVVWTSTTGAHATFGAIRSHWVRSGAESGPLGYPDGEMTCGARSCSQSFQGGTAVWSAVAGVQVVEGAVRDVWVTTGGEGGPLRAPLAPATCGLPDGGCRQEFEGGTVASSTTTGAWPTYGVIRNHWKARGYESGVLGYITGELTCDDLSCSQPFQGGVVTWTAAAGIS